MSLGTCPACHTRVLWAVTSVNSKRLMLNPKPDEAGNQAAYRDGLGTLRTRQLKDGEQPYGWEKRYMPHPATCTGPPPLRPRHPAPVVLPVIVIPMTAAR